MRKSIKQINRENMRIARNITSDEKYLYFLKHFDKKNNFREEIEQITIYDKLENHGMNILMKKIHKLKNNKKFSVTTHYRKPGRKDLDFIFGNMEGQSTFLIADIKFNEDKWISGIYISGTYVTNSDLLIEYSFPLKNSISSYASIHQFVKDHQMHNNKYLFYSTYQIRVEGKKFFDCITQEESNFYDIFQDLLCELLYTEFGRKYPLPMEACSHIYRFNKIKEKAIANSFLTEVYKHDNEFLLFPVYEKRFFAMNYYHGKKHSSSHLFLYFSDYSVEMYYKAFRSIEISELESKMRKYLNSRKKSVSAKDMKWMINKLRGIEEKEHIIKTNIEQNEKRKWKRFENKVWIEEDLVFQNTASSHFKDLYKRNLEYLQSISTTRDNKIIYSITIISLIIALLSTIISLWQVFRPDEPIKVVNERNYYNDNREMKEYKFSIFD